MRGVSRSGVWGQGYCYAMSSNPTLVSAWRRMYCRDLVKLSGQAASNAQKHLLKHHQAELQSQLPQLQDEVSVIEEVDRDDLIEPSQSISQVSVSTVLSTVPKLRQLAFAPNFTKYRNWLLRWCIETHISYNATEYDAFKMMQWSIHPLVEQYLVSRRTLSRWTEDDFDRGKIEMR